MKFRLILTTAILFFNLSASVLLAQGNQALRLDKDGAYMTLPALGLNNKDKPQTIELWYKPIDLTKPAIMGNGTGSRTYDRKWYICLTSIGSKIEVWAGRAQLAPEINVTSNISFVDNNWYHIALTYDGASTATAKLYINGVLENSGSVAIPSSAESEDWNIGRADNAYADAVFDDVRIWNVVRTEEEIKSTMNITLNGNEPGLVGYWSFDDGTANDLSPNGNHGELKGDAKIVESDLAIAPIVLMPQSIIPRAVGESFSLGIDAAAYASLNNFTFDLTFNPSILQAVSVEPGSFLSNNGKDKIKCETPRIDNAKGLITGISCRREGADGVSGDGELIRINFKAIGVGESILRIENASFSATDGNQIKSGARDGIVIVFPPHGRITGRVIDFQGKPVGGIEVFALKEDVPVGISGKTDGDGNYIIENITEAGKVTVRTTRKAGLLPGITTVSVQIGETTDNVDVVLEQPSILNGVVDENGFIRNWLLLGPIPWENDANRLITDQFVVTDPKKPFQPQEGETKSLQPRMGEYGEGVAKTQRWTLHADSDGDIDLAGLYGQIKGVVYAFTLVKSPQEREVTLQLGSDDGVIVWLNDKLVHLNGTTRSRQADQDAVANLTLNAGWNRLLIKVENQGSTWGFLARFAEGKGLKPITDLDITPQWQSGIVPGGEIKEFSIQIPLTRGVNMVSLPLNPETPYTASTLAAALNSTIVIQVKDGHFDAYVHAGYIGTDFPIRVGNGYIVNLMEAQNFPITGKPWGEPVPAAPSASPRIPGEFGYVLEKNSVSLKPWAFVIAGQIDGEVPVGGQLRVTNLCTKASIVAPISPAGQFTAAFVDMSQRPVVGVGDEFIVQLIGADGSTLAGTSKLHVLPDDTSRAYLLTHLFARPEQTILLQNYPNPFNPETWIPYQLARPSDVTIYIYNASGQLIRTLLLGRQNTGFYLDRSKAAYWNGRNTSGEKVASGLYFYQLTAGDFTAIRRMVIIK